MSRWKWGSRPSADSIGLSAGSMANARSTTAAESGTPRDATSRMSASGEDAHTTGSHEESHDDQRDSGEDCAAQERDDADDHEDHGDDPQYEFHVVVVPARSPHQTCARASGHFFDATRREHRREEAADEADDASDRGDVEPRIDRVTEARSEVVGDLVQLVREHA